MTLTLVDALQALRPNDSFIVRGEIAYENIQLADENKTLPTEQEVEEKLAVLKYVEEVNVYQEKRKLEYPSWGDQLDQIYHNGIDAWKADIKAIKDKYPKQTLNPNELQKRRRVAVFNLQKKNYIKAKTRLERYELSAGVKNEDGTYEIEPLPIIVGQSERNPLVVQDEKERAAAQEVINNTPQAVIDSVSS
tara:strand:+ start:1030 stop:1605 length:576 start_codon:yes stop_codon:yes gene_type:complete